MAQEITNTCGMPNVDLSTIHQQFTLPENTKIDNLTHPTQHIQVVDAMGRLVDTFVAENPHFTVWQPNINLPNGLYFIVSDNRQNSIIKVIVQR